MSTLGNVIWFVFGGFLLFIHYVFSGLILCITIIGITFGIQVFKLASIALSPFGKEIISSN